VFFGLVVLISVESEHDRLEEIVDLGQLDEACERADVSRLLLQKCEQLTVEFALTLVLQ
jgi:hypothetical protein